MRSSKSACELTNGAGAAAAAPGAAGGAVWRGIVAFTMSTFAASKPGSIAASF
jgi:hypothetical protein